LDWKERELLCSEVGLQLRDTVVRYAKPVTLRSIGLEVRISARLVGEATLWVFSRGDSVTDPDAAICKIRKEQDCQRIFLIFGAALGKDVDFKFLRKQEIPHVGPPTEQGLMLDYTDISLSFTDNGDDRVTVRTVGKA
jgi:hypothetical protein